MCALLVLALPLLASPTSADHDFKYPVEPDHLLLSIESDAGFWPPEPRIQFRVFGDGSAQVYIYRGVRKGRGIDKVVQLNASEVDGLLEMCAGAFAFDSASVEEEKKALSHYRSMGDSDLAWVTLRANLDGYRLSGVELWDGPVAREIRWANPSIDARWHPEVDALQDLARCADGLILRAYELGDEIEDDFR